MNQFRTLPHVTGNIYSKDFIMTCTLRLLTPFLGIRKKEFISLLKNRPPSVGVISRRK